MDAPRKSEFAVLCKRLRENAWPRKLKHREVAMFLGIKPRTYGNVETSPWKVISREKAERLAEVYELGPGERAELLAAWERCPLSLYGERRRLQHEKNRARRNRLRHYDRMHLALVEVVSVLLSTTRGSACTCLFGGGTEYDPTRDCEFCEALDTLGISHALDGARLAERLAEQQSELEKTLNIGRHHGTTGTGTTDRVQTDRRSQRKARPASQVGSAHRHDPT